MGAVGALAPTVFLLCAKIIHISVPLFLTFPEVVLILAPAAPTLFSPNQRQCKLYIPTNPIFFKIFAKLNCCALSSIMHNVF